MEDLPVSKYMQEIIIKSKIRDFKVKFTNDFSFIDEFLKIPYFVIVVESPLYKIYKTEIFDKFPKEKIIILNLNEKNKTLETVTKIYRILLPLTPKKNLTVISFGGGITQDITGFVASTLYRGINWIYIPTTLLAMVDSSIGLKTSLNFENFKNVLGTFYPPKTIYINPNFLKTLKQLDYFSGIGEIIKFYLMKKNAYKNIKNSIKKINKLKRVRDNKFVTEIIKESIKIKLDYMEGDEFDQGRRNLLNYGHDLGHALESTSNFAIPHGLAIVIGIIFANMVSLKEGFLDKNIFDFINNEMLFPMLNLGNLKLKKKYFNINLLLENIKKDKKRRNNNLSLIMLKENFKLEKITDFKVEEFKQILPYFLRILNPYFK